MLMVMEVTERPVNGRRVAGTFTSKIAPAPADYVFAVHLDRVDAEAFRRAERYFAQGYDVDFVDLSAWVYDTLATLGSAGRRAFQENMVELLSGSDVPRAIRLAWNEALQTVL